MPHWLYSMLFGPTLRGGLAVALFTIVMYLAIIPKSSTIYKKLMPIRRELSMAACIFSYFHNFAYGMFIFPKFFNGFVDLKSNEISATFISLILMLMLLPLFITSFKKVQNKMSAKTWKKIQRLAYPFFGLLYLHIMIIFLSRPSEHYFNFLTYSVVFAIYAVLRIKKALSHR